jgi:hypothetical protein
VFDAATIRPHDWDIALYLHVLGAMVATGAIALAFVYLVLAWRGSPGAFRAAYKSLLYGAAPGYVVMRLAAAWIASKEGLEDSDLSWIGIGFAVADIGLLFLVIATATAGVWSRRSPDGGNATVRVPAILTGILLVAYVIAVFAMTTKPA